MNKLEPFISIIIPVRNGEKTIKKCIDSLWNLEYKNFEIIVINDGSADKTNKILSQYLVKIIDTGGVGPSRARNIGIKESKGDFIALTDADCIVDKHWLIELLRAFEDPKVIGVGGIQKSPPDDTEFGKKVQLFISSTGLVTDYGRSVDKLKEVRHNPSCNVMYRKEAFTDGRTFLEGFWPAEDVEFDYRLRKLGYRFMFNPQAIVYHYRADNTKKFIIMMYSYGRNNGYLCRTYGFFRILYFMPFLLIILLASFILSNFKTVFLLTLSFLAFLYFMLRSKDLKSTLYLFWFLFLTIIVWNMGFAMGLFRLRFKK